MDLLAALIRATNAQIIDKFKELFPPEIESQLLDIDDLERLIIKAHQLIQLFKPKQTVAANVLAHATQELPVDNNIVSISGHNHKTRINRGARNQRSNNFQSNRPIYKSRFPQDT